MVRKMICSGCKKQMKWGETHLILQTIGNGTNVRHRYHNIKCLKEWLNGVETGIQTSGTTKTFR